VRWVTYERDGRQQPGLVVGDAIHGVTGVERLLDLLGDDGERLRAAADAATADPLEVVPLADATLRAPIPSPPSVRDFMSFEEHVKTSTEAIGQQLDPGWYERPVFYFSNPAAVCGPGEPVAIPPGATELDYELEVAAYIGRPGRDIAPEDAEAHIAGYTILNDWSARDLQVREMRQLLGPAKGKDSATTMGPMFVTPDELEPFRAGNGHRLTMTASVNGRPYSRGDWSTLHWSFGQMIAYASRGTQLVPGDVIGSGTVGTGCILELSRVHGVEAYPYLQPGDEVTLEVEGLGAISNVVVPGVPPVPLG
jgi:2-keto-4-pentenoate hydratase/2-oxohepta-3-ene-1,7-dioic acid hydratase in catechol pathway